MKEMLQKAKSILSWRVLFVFLIVLGTSFFIEIFSCLQARTLRAGIFPIARGENGKYVAQHLAEEGFVQDWHCPYFITRLYGLGIKSGDYRLEEGEVLRDVIHRFAEAQYGDVYIWLTFPEGATVQDYAGILKKHGIVKDAHVFVEKYENQEGRLFPDTYAFLPSVTEEDVVSAMQKNFREHFQQAKEGATIHPLPSDEEGIIMASLVEKEAGTSLEEKQIIAGILWKRLQIGMPLQVDAPFLYERQKTSAQLSTQDLREHSPYNTYTQKGLPIGPIGNPGYDALYATFHPLMSEYLYYLHDKDGKVHFARNYREHLKNKRLYLQ